MVRAPAVAPQPIAGRPNGTHTSSATEAGAQTITVTLCVQLRAHDGKQGALTAYENRVVDIAEEHGARVVFRGRMHGEPGEPTELQILSFPSEESSIT